MTNAGRSRFIASQGGLPVVLYPTDQFPTIASIPTGAVVYDTVDGVVKKKVQVFHNEGSDWVDVGRPSWLAKVRPAVDSFSVSCICAPSVVDSGTIISWGAGVATTSRQFQLFCETELGATGFSVWIGGTKTRLTAPVVANKWAKFYARQNGGATLLSYNGLSSTGVAGSYTGTENVFVGGRTDGASYNLEGDTALIIIEDGSGALLDCIDFTRTDLWDGGATGYTCAGNPFNISDGAPFGVAKETLVPLSLLIY